MSIPYVKLVPEDRCLLQDLRSKICKLTEAQFDGELSVNGSLIGPLNPLPVYGGLTDAELRASPLNFKNSSLSSGNTTFDLLLASETFTGQWEEVVDYSSVIIACKSDTNGSLYAQFSSDGTTVHSQVPYTVTANLNEVHRLTVTRRYFRVVFVNSATPHSPSGFHIQCIFGSQNLLTSPMNSVLQSDSDAITVRELDFNMLVAEGLYQNRVATVKDGVIESIPNGLSSTDIWSNGGTYTGFPQNVEQGQIFVNGADTGTVWYSYLESDTSTDYVFASLNIAGPGTYNLGHNIWRCNYAYFVKNSFSSTSNVADIVVRHATTTTNIFCVIKAGIGQTYCSAYTVPYNSSVYIDRWSGNIKGSSSGTLDGFVWYRPYNSSPYLRFPFVLQFGSLYFDDTDFLVKIPARTDFIPRIVEASAGGLKAKFSYRLVKVKE